jgi:hypothetical protein
LSIGFNSVIVVLNSMEVPQLCPGRCEAIILIESVQFTNPHDFPLYIDIRRCFWGTHVKTAFHRITTRKLLDSGNTAFFNTEFHIDCQLSRKANRHWESKKVACRLYIISGRLKGGKEVVFKWRWDVANIEDPTGMGVRHSRGSSPHYGDIELTFRIVIWATGRGGQPPANVFTFVAVGHTIAAEEVAPGDTTQTTDVGDDAATGNFDPIVLEAAPPRPQFALEAFLPPREKSQSDAQVEPPHPAEPGAPSPPDEAPRRHHRHRPKGSRRATDAASDEVRLDGAPELGPSPQPEDLAPPVDPAPKERSRPMMPAAAPQRPKPVAASRKPQAASKGLQEFLAIPKAASDGPVYLSLLQSSCVLSTSRLSARQVEIDTNFQRLVRSHSECAIDMAISHCCYVFSRCVLIAFSDSAWRDFSEDFMAPIRAHAIFSFSELHEQHLLDLCDPLFTVIDALLLANHDSLQLFALLATLLRFGEQLSDLASLYTAAHERTLQRLAEYITAIMKLLALELFATIAGSIREDGSSFFDDEDSQRDLAIKTHSWSLNCSSYRLYEAIIQMIIVETAKAVDARIFNILLNTSTEFTDDKVTRILHSIRRLQDAFQCVSRNFETAFPCLHDFVMRVQSLWGGIISDLPRTDRMRSIIERCRPEIVLGAELTLDDIGKHCDQWSDLNVVEPTFSFVFTFEWLWLQAPGHKDLVLPAGDG